MMNEYKGLLIAVFAVFLTFLSLYTMPFEITVIVVFISFGFGIYGSILHAHTVIKRFKSYSDSNQESK
jgi:hypothetical protein